MDHFFVKHVT